MDDREREYYRKRNRILEYTFLILLTCNYVECMDVEIEQMRLEGIEKHDVGIFVEHMVEFIHSKISLRPLLNGLHNFDKMNLEFSKRATTKFGKLLITKIDRIANRIQDRAESLNGNRVDRLHKIEKRAIEFIGNLISKAFGNPGPEDMKKLQANLMAMKRAIERQRDNSIILHRDIDNGKHEVEKQNIILKQISVELYRSENAVDQLQNELLDLQGYLEMEAMSEAIGEILESLYDIKRDGKVGRCNLKGLSRDFLIENLRRIESNKLGIAPVFASWEWEKYYQFEMCSIALHKDDLWVTLRIPVIKPNEKMFRTLPSSSHTWIRHELDALGIDINYFKSQNHEIYSIIANNNFGMCSILGTTRVCNIRMTTYTEQNRFIVPIELSTNRILIIGNDTSNDTVILNSNCNGKNTNIEIKNWSILRIPSLCEVKNKNFAIESKSKSESVDSSVEFESVTEIEYRRIANMTKRSRPIEVPQLNDRHGNTDSMEFELNDKSTLNELKTVDLNHEGILNEFRAVKVGGLSSSVCIAAVLIIMVLIRCRKKCRSEKMNERGVNVSVNLERNDEKAINESEQGRLEERKENERLLNDESMKGKNDSFEIEREKPKSINQFK